MEILDYSYEQQLEQLHGMRRDVADLVTAKQRVDARSAIVGRHQLRKLDIGARKALELGREDLAREALERGQLFGQELIRAQSDRRRLRPSAGPDGGRGGRIPLEDPTIPRA